jgi:hypothetical protein
LFINVRIINHRETPLDLRLNWHLEFNLMPSWFGGWPNGEDAVVFEDGLLLAYDYDRFRPFRWGVACGSTIKTKKYSVETMENPSVRGEMKDFHTLQYDLTVGPNQELEIPFAISAENQTGYPEARDRLIALIDSGNNVFKLKVAAYEKDAFEGVQLECSDPWFVEAFQVAKANLIILMADLRPFLGAYLYAGIPEYVQLFGTDTAYSIPGIVSAGFANAAEDALTQLGLKAKILCGRVPHEITTNGRVFHPGNTQETSQFAIACWDYFKWTGDMEFLEWVYPLCQEGVLDYSPAHWDADLDYYLDGNSMIERPGMGDEKLDSVCYFCRAILVIAEMADVLGWSGEGNRYRDLANTLRSAINEDWWMESESLFADSLEEDHTQKMDGHWIIAIPMESNVADREHGVRALRRIEKDWVNQWGMVHTREKEDLVWTLPTGVLANGEFNYGHADTGTWLLKQIATTMEHKSWGTFKELIPEGLSFVQLWSPAMFLQGVIEGIFRIDPRANDNRVILRLPRLSREWSHATLKDVIIGSHTINLDLRDCSEGRPQKITLTHHTGDTDLKVEMELLMSAADLPIKVVGGADVHSHYKEIYEHSVLKLELVLATRQQVEVRITADEVIVGFAMVAP